MAIKWDDMKAKSTCGLAQLLLYVYCIQYRDPPCRPFLSRWSQLSVRQLHVSTTVKAAVL